jgi:hypothetical protein
VRGSGQPAGGRFPSKAVNRPFSKHNSAAIGRFPYRSVSGYSRKVPMSKVPIFAGFDFAEIVMLTASVAVIAAVTVLF